MKALVLELVSNKIVYVNSDIVEDFITYCKTMSVMPHGGAMDESGQYFYL